MLVPEEEGSRSFRNVRQYSFKDIKLQSDRRVSSGRPMWWTKVSLHHTHLQVTPTERQPFCNERAVVYFASSFDSLTEKDTLIYEVLAVRIFVFKVSSTLISQYFCLPIRKLSIRLVYVYIHLMIITSFIISMLYDLKIQPVSNMWNICM